MMSKIAYRLTVFGDAPTMAILSADGTREMRRPWTPGVPLVIRRRQLPAKIPRLFRMSRKHVQIRCEELDGAQLFFVCDLSANGTLLNGSRMMRHQKRPLHDGDELGIIWQQNPYGRATIHLGVRFSIVKNPVPGHGSQMIEGFIPIYASVNIISPNAHQQHPSSEPRAVHPSTPKGASRVLSLGGSVPAPVGSPHAPANHSQPAEHTAQYTPLAACGLPPDGAAQHAVYAPPLGKHGAEDGSGGYWPHEAAHGANPIHGLPGPVDDDARAAKRPRTAQWPDAEHGGPYAAAASAYATPCSAYAAPSSPVPSVAGSSESGTPEPSPQLNSSRGAGRRVARTKLYADEVSGEEFDDEAGEPSPPPEPSPSARSARDPPFGSSRKADRVLKWTPSEEQKLIRAATTMVGGVKSWRDIAVDFPGRTPDAVRNKFKKLLEADPKLALAFKERPKEMAGALDAQAVLPEAPPDGGVMFMQPPGSVPDQSVYASAYPPYPPYPPGAAATAWSYERPVHAAYAPDGTYSQPAQSYVHALPAEEQYRPPHDVGIATH